MRARHVLVAGSLWAVLLALAPAVAADGGRYLPAGFQRGMNVAAWWNDAYSAPASDQALAALAATGTTDAALVTTWYMTSPTASSVAPTAQTPSDASLLHAMATARSLGMRVVLKLHVDVADGSFRGDIAPADRAAWFASYTTMVDHYADLAAQGGAEMMVIGTELTSMSTDDAAWRALIADARARFPGALTFAANQMSGAQQITFWDALDYIGVDDYMPLTDSTDPDPALDTLVQAWNARGYVAALAQLHQQWGRPVLLTEIGYQSRVGTAITPWTNASGAPDQGPQERAVDAAYRALSGQPWLAGLYWWDWVATGPEADGGWSLEGTQAADTIRAWNLGAVPPAAAIAPIGQVTPAARPAARPAAPTKKAKARARAATRRRRMARAAAVRRRAHAACLRRARRHHRSRARCRTRAGARTSGRARRAHPRSARSRRRAFRRAARAAGT